ncbi:MAG: Grx4 family monothiol glutaredoxin [Proteobacteria bacterium]|jgi:monothiol glutaredoxin|nr:Grx4 family monothiol glutaredoxin [Pseudomonadota bacterium]
MNEQTKAKIEDMISTNKVFLFMKGYKNQPMCGFSNAVIQCLNQVGANYETFNVLDDNEVREGIKEYSNWPTIPQLYVNKQFVGGCDIVREMFSTGELKTLVE